MTASTTGSPGETTSTRTDDIRKKWEVTDGRMKLHSKLSMPSVAQSKKLKENLLSFYLSLKF
jgi:hypothetical protein